VPVEPADCWYDGATDSYHDYEFSNTDMVREGTVETTTEVETYAVEETDESMVEDWSGSYEFPSETAASEPSDSETDWVEDLPEANPGNESMTYDSEANVEEMCPESAVDSDPSMVAEDAATEEAWRGDDSAEYGYESAYPSEGTAYPYGGPSESEMTDTQSTQTTESAEASEEGMERIQEQAAADAETIESPTAWPSGEHDYSYGVGPYHYEYHPDAYNVPVPTWEDSEPGAPVVDGENSEPAAAPSASSAAAEFDGEIILSLARTLDRVGVTLQSISRYLTEMATADLAKRHSESLER
jgi:hypothetical protein